MFVTLMTSEGCHTIALPKTISGKYWLKAVYQNSICEEQLGIEAEGGKWFVRSGRNVSVLDESEKPASERQILPSSFYKVIFRKRNQEAFLFAEPKTADRMTYHKFVFPSEQTRTITIGRKPENNICYHNAMVSSHHAELHYENGIFTIMDHGSTNGTYVNHQKIASRLLEIGDVIYIMGLKIVIGNDMIAINNPDNAISVDYHCLSPLQDPHQLRGGEIAEGPEQFRFARSPHFKTQITPYSITVDLPPTKQNAEEMPAYLALGSSMTMGLASMTTALFSVNNAIANENISAAMPSIVMSVSMLTGSVLWPILTRSYNKKKKNTLEKKRTALYRKYLDEVQYHLDQEIFEQQKILNESHVSLNECYNRILSCDRKLWERAQGEEDFLQLRLGTGEIPMFGEVKLPIERVTLSDDVLLDEMRSAFAKPRTLKDVPITISLYEDHVVGLMGSAASRSQMLKNLIMQLVTFYGYDYVKIVYLSSDKNTENLDFIRWLPHVWDDSRQIRFIGTSDNEIKEISMVLEREFEGRSTEKNAQHTPYYILIAADPKMSMSVGILRKVLSSENNAGFSVIFSADELRALPKECSRVISLNEDDCYVMDKDNVQERNIHFQMELAEKYQLYDISCILSNIQLETSNAVSELPTHVEFLEMYGVKKAEHLNVVERWKNNDPTMTLEAPIGKNTYGDLFMLDLHQKIHGPHGLVAGMTGSGKSEFIITYILSMAINYHPHEVAFILIDYKGGGMAKTFEKLPHTVGIITNLDGAAVKRSLVSIKSELNRRQEAFLKLGALTGESNLDIYKYQKLYRSGVTSEPMPHLFIISDEFAELKTQRPEFMEQLISIARIGRSLGVHLILATQKPAGVVNEQIWSNSKFKICLKVQTKEDSQSMLNRPDAASLVQTGRFYLQVGYNELFEIGQSAWAGAPYIEAEDVANQAPAQVISVIDNIGRSVASADISRKGMTAKAKTNRKQVDVITEYLCETAREAQIFAKPLWCEPVNETIFYQDLCSKYQFTREPYVLDPLLGEVDDPENQRQYLLTVPISEQGNVAVFGAVGSGKAMFLNMMLYSLIVNHTAEEVNIYIMDFDAETLIAFKDAPQVGDVVLIDEETKIDKLLLMLSDEIQSRKKRYVDYGGDYKSYMRSGQGTDPSIVLAINNITAFEESYEQKLNALIRIARNGSKYGIYVVVTRIGAFGMRYRLLSCFTQKFVLQSSDETEYVNVLGKTEGMVPTAFEGRGLYRDDESVLEFQTASFTEDGNVQDAIIQVCKAVAACHSGAGAKPIPILPEKVTFELLQPHAQAAEGLQVPIGYTERNVEVFCYDFSRKYILPVLSASDLHNGFAENLMKLLAAGGNCEVMFFDPQRIAAGVPDNVQYAWDEKTIEALNAKLFYTTVARNNEYKTLLEEGQQPMIYHPLVVVIASLEELRAKLTEDGRDKLANVLLRGERDYQMHIVLADKSSQLVFYAQEAWYKKHVDERNAIWLGGGITRQSRIRYSGAANDKISDDFAYAIRNGRTELLKIPVTDEQ